MPATSNPRKSVRLWESRPVNESVTDTISQETLRFWLTLRHSVDLRRKLRHFIRTPRMFDGMLVNLHEAYWSSSLAGAMSATYLHHFELEVREGSVERALSVLERVRGRTAAAVLENKVSFSKNESDEVR